MSTEAWEAIWLSVQVAIVSVAASLPLGVGCGWLLARKQFFGKTILETCVNLPLVLPPVVTGYLLLLIFGRSGVIGSSLDEWLGIRFIFDWKGAALASAIVSFPLLVRSIRLAFASIDPRLEFAARVCGARPIDTFFTVSLPLARRGLIAGCVLAFARSLGEFGATIMIAGNIPGETRTIPLYIYNQLETPGGLTHAWGIIIFSIMIAAVAVWCGEHLESRST